MQLKRRQLLVLLLVASQLGCMSFGVLWGAQWLRSRFEEVIDRTADAQSRSLVFDLARRISEQSIASADPGTKDWTTLQRLCERTKPSHDGFVTIVNGATGALVCHSKLRDDPTLLGKFPGRSVLVTDEGVNPLIDAARKAEAARKPPASGQVEISGRLYQATCLSLPKLNAVVVAHHSQLSLDRSVADLVTPVLQIGFVVTATVVGVSALITTFLVKRFDNTLSLVSASVEGEVQRRTQSLLRSRNAVVFGLAKLAESRDRDAGQHLERMRTYVTILASEMAKSHSQIDHHYVANLAVASSLHDVGKMGVPDAVIHKLGRLTPAERRAMQLHTVLGGQCLAVVGRQLTDQDDFLELGHQIAVAHHEQWDGSGYPNGLQGKEIPLAARIVAVADVYDALTSHRAYRPAIGHAEAVEWIASNYGTQFDPEVVEALLAREQDFAKISALATSEAAATSDAVGQLAESTPAGADTPVAHGRLALPAG